MEIRKANYDDVKILNHFLTLLIRDEKQYDLGIDESFVVTNMYENFIEDPSKLIIVAEEKGKIIGYLYAKIKQTDPTYKYKIAILDALYVDNAYRRRGIAKSLIENLKKWAIHMEVKKIEVNVWSNNIKAKKLYEQENFKTVVETLSLDVN